MSKRSNRGKAYFYAMGQRDAIAEKGILLSAMYRVRKVELQHLHSWAFRAWLNGYNGY